MCKSRELGHLLALGNPSQVRLRCAGSSRTAPPTTKAPHSLPSLFQDPESPSRLPKSPTELELHVRQRCKSGTLSPNEALGYFQALVRIKPIACIFTFNHVLGSVCKSENYSDAVALYRKMNGAGVKPDLCTLNILINCCCHLEMMSWGFGVFAEIVKRGFEPDEVTFTTLFKGLCLAGKAVDAVEMFDKLALRGFDGMVGSDLYRALISELCQTRESALVLEFHKWMTKQGFEADAQTCAVIVGALCKAELIDDALELFRDQISQHTEPSVILYNSVIDGLCKSQRLGQAVEIYDEMVERGIPADVITYNSLIHAFCQARQWTEANKMLHLMTERGIPPDVFTFSILIDFLCKTGKLTEAGEVFEVMIQKRVDPDGHTYSTLINGLCLAGRLDDAVVPNVVTCTSLINGLCKRGMLAKAEKLFLKMQVEGCAPNSISYDVLIRAFLQDKQVDKALQLLQEMRTRKLSPSEALVSRLSRSMRVVGSSSSHFPTPRKSL